MSEWITDRLPTVEDAVHYCVLLWDEDDGVLVWSYDAVNEGQPWQPIPKPNPYVKPKRWTVKWGGDDADFFALFDSGKFSYYLPMLFREHADAAQRICDIYNEVMP